MQPLPPRRPQHQRRVVPLRRLRSWLRIARVLLLSQYALMLEYRAEILLWALSGLMPLLMLSLWSKAGVSAASGLNPMALTRYFISAFVVRQFTVVWVVHAFEEDNLLGRLSPYLLQPLPLIWRYVAAHVAEQATRLPFVAAMVGLVLLAMPAAAWLPSPTTFLLALLATHLAFWINFLLQFAITMLCFWSERASALERLLYIPYLFLSGLVAPLEVFPPAVRNFALHTPFPSMLYFPARLLSGESVDLAAGFGAMAAWLALLVPINLLLWRAGVRRYAALGA